jgi:hypothetical protein
MTGLEMVGAIAIIVFFIAAVFIALARRPEPEDGDLEHFDHEHGERDAR